MSNYIVERRDTGEVVYAYGADQAVEWPDYPFSEFNHVLEKVVEAAPIPRTITKLEYLRRFTTVERVTIRTASKSEPVLEDYLAMMELAGDIDLDDADTVGAVSMLEGAGLIATGRAAEILA